MIEREPDLVGRLVGKGSRWVLGLLGAVVLSLGAWATVSTLAAGQRLPPLYGPIWLVGLGALAMSFAWRQPKRVHSISGKARLLSLLHLALACVSCLLGACLALAVVVGGEFDSAVPWILLGVAILMVAVVPMGMLKLGARHRSAAEIEETREKLFHRGMQ